jgi:hypothetical protein
MRLPNNDVETQQCLRHVKNGLFQSLTLNYVILRHHFGRPKKSREEIGTRSSGNEIRQDDHAFHPSARSQALFLSLIELLSCDVFPGPSAQKDR